MVKLFLFEIIASFIPENNTPLIKEDLPAPETPQTNNQPLFRNYKRFILDVAEIYVV